ncbi:MAG: hypothetical protein Q9162_007429 [Coniocarpon cinnabarinum]
MYATGCAALLLASVAEAQIVNQVTLQRTPLKRSATAVKAHSGVVVVPEVDDQSFWFANFTVGASPSLSLLIDTGSADVYLNPAIYAPSPNSKNLRKPFSITFSTTNSDGSGTETVTGSLYADQVATSNLSVPQQTLGASNPVSPEPFPHDGLIGFAGQSSSASNSVPWFTNLCQLGIVDACRFGLKFFINGTGNQFLGGVDPEWAASLTRVPISDQWIVAGDVTAGSSMVAQDATFITDSGTAVVYGPLETVQAIFEALAIPYSLRRGTNPRTDPSYIFGYTPCDAPPNRDVNFVLGGEDFHIDAVPWNAVDNGGNNCTAVLQGTDAFGESWLVGQAFFQSKYVDHDVDAGMMGFAALSG